MLPCIVHPAPSLCRFIEGLELPLSQPQLRHLTNTADALLVCETERTLAALHRQFLDTVDPSNMADFFRISPWQPSMVRERLQAFLVQWAIDQVPPDQATPVIQISLDDSIAEKDKATRHLEPVDWHYDHIESRKGRHRYKNGLSYLGCTLLVGLVELTYDIQPYLRECTVRRLNRERPKEQRLHFISKTRLAQQILRSLVPLLPRGWRVYVHFDAWYSSAALIKFCRCQDWHVICAIKSNRKLDGTRIDRQAAALRHKRYTRVAVTAADGKATTYLVRVSYQ